MLIGRIIFVSAVTVYSKPMGNGSLEVSRKSVTVTRFDLKLVDTLYYKFIKNGPTSCLFPGNCLTSFSGSGAEQNFLVS